MRLGWEEYLHWPTQPCRKRRQNCIALQMGRPLEAAPGLVPGPGRGVLLARAVREAGQGGCMFSCANGRLGVVKHP